MNDFMKYIGIAQQLAMRLPVFALLVLAANFSSFESLVTKISIQWVKDVLCCTYAIAFIADVIFTFIVEINLYKARRMKP